MSSEIINAIVYTNLDERLGPVPVLWHPLDLSERIRMSVGIKSITMLSADDGIVPKTLVIIPFPSFNLKGLTKYIEREDATKRGGVAISSITLLFNAAHDIVFYKYIDYLESVFADIAQNIIELEEHEAKSDEIFVELNKLQTSISEILDDLRNKEKLTSKMEAFPDDKGVEERELRYNFKIIVCGDPGVGKTSTILRFTDNAFIRTYIPTLGINISEKNIRIKGSLVKLILWDIAGQVKFETMRRHFYKGAEALILIFDLTNHKTFESIPNWFKDIKNHMIEKAELIGFILGNKEDLTDMRMINEEEAKKIANRLNLEYIETSALTGKNVESSFYKVAETLIKSKNE